MDDLLTGAALLERAQIALTVPLMQALDARPIDPLDPAAGVTCEVAGLALNGFGSLHASALSALMESAGYVALVPHLRTTEHAVTHTVTLALVAAAAQGAHVVARGEVDRRTRRLAFVTVTAHVDDLLIARAQLVKSIVRFDG